MSKIIRKLRPRDYWRIGEHESWFTDLAAEGLHLTEMGLIFAKFTKGEPKKTRYRIEIVKNKEITAEQKGLYVESGWDYVTRYGNFNVFSSPAELKAPEIHTDPVEQSYTLQELDKKFKTNAIISVVGTLISLALVSSIWFIDATPVLDLVEGYIISQIVLIIALLYGSYETLQAAKSIRILRNTLLEGKPINHHAPWQKGRGISLIITVMFFGFFILTSIMPWIQIASHKTYNLPEETPNLPFVRLADVEQNPKMIKVHRYYEDDIDFYNKYRSEWSFFAPVQYETDESGKVPGEMWLDGSGEYSPSITSQVYQLRYEFLTEGLISDLIKRYGAWYDGGEFKEIEHPDLDLLIVHEREAAVEIFAGKGKGVIYLRYYGFAEQEKIIENIAQKIFLPSW